MLGNDWWWGGGGLKTFQVSIAQCVYNMMGDCPQIYGGTYRSPHSTMPPPLPPHPQFAGVPTGLFVNVAPRRSKVESRSRTRLTIKSDAHKDHRPVTVVDMRCPHDCSQGPLSPLPMIQVCPPGLSCVEGMKNIAVWRLWNGYGQAL